MAGRPTLTWLRKNFPTTPGMDAPDYVIVNRFMDGVLNSHEAMAGEGSTPYAGYALAYGYLHSKVSDLAREVPGVIEWLNRNTPRRRGGR